MKTQYTNRMIGIIGIIGIIAIVAWLGACGSDDDNDNADAGPTADAHHEEDGGHHEEDGGHGGLDEEGCAHLTQGPFADVTATEEASSAPAIAADHKAYRVSLPVGKAGLVTFSADETGDLVLFFDAAAPVKIKDDTGAEVALEESLTKITACAEVEGKHTVELPAVGLYTIELGPVDGDKVTVVAEEGDHAH